MWLKWKDLRTRPVTWPTTASLSRKRADAVVHYLAVEHNIPLRSIRELGVGSDFPDANNKTRDDRKENRRVDVKIYMLDMTGPGAQASNAAPAVSQRSKYFFFESQVNSAAGRPVTGGSVALFF